MLLELKVSNFAIIENLQIEFGAGLNILSGETGAGKSVLLKSLGLLMGGKGSVEQIRTGAAQAAIEGSFDLKSRPDLVKHLKDQGVECEESTLIVRRVIAEDKSKVYLNGSLSTLGTLRDVVAPLIDLAGSHAPLIEMTGQHENRNLLSTAYHLDLLDQYAGTWDLRHQYETDFQKWNELQEKRRIFIQESQAKAQRLDFLKYQRDEIAALDLSPGEDLTLENDLRRLKSSSKITSFVDQAEEILVSDEDSAQSRIKAIYKKAQELCAIDPSMKDRLERLVDAENILVDFVYDLRKSLKADADAELDLEKLEHRLSQLRKLQKKYGDSVDAILSALIQFETEISSLENSESHIQELSKQIETLEKNLLTVATTLHKKRVGSAKMLEKSVNEELSDLNMKGVQFVVALAAKSELSATGLTDIEFQSQTSPKDAPRALAKFASGGELSRILLSLKRVVGSSKWPRTYLFDEVDTGVSGPTAEKVGRKLKSIAKGQQVICITHLPQVAAFGDQHYFIQKGSGKDAVRMEVTKLLKDDRTQEIARLISGQKITKTSLAHAKELLSGAKG